MVRGVVVGIVVVMAGWCSRLCVVAVSIARAVAVFVILAVLIVVVAVKVGYLGEQVQGVGRVEQVARRKVAINVGAGHAD